SEDDRLPIQLREQGEREGSCAPGKQRRDLDDSETLEGQLALKNGSGDGAERGEDERGGRKSDQVRRPRSKHGFQREDGERRRQAGQCNAANQAEQRRTLEAFGIDVLSLDDRDAEAVPCEQDGQ